MKDQSDNVHIKWEVNNSTSTVENVANTKIYSQNTIKNKFLGLFSEMHGTFHYPMTDSNKFWTNIKSNWYNRKEGKVLFNDALNTFHLLLFDVRHG